MKAFCQRCNKDVDVDAETPRCPTCLRQSSLLFGRAPPPPDAADPPAVAPPTKAASMALALSAFAFLLVSMIPLELTSWMTLTDVCFVFAAVGGLFTFWRGGFFKEEPKSTASKTALVVGGVVFGLLTLAILWGVVSLFSDPLAPQEGHRFGPSHNWGLGTMTLGIAVVTGQLSRMLLRKRFARAPEHRSRGALVPLAGAAPNLTEARDYRDGARPKIVTLAEAAGAIARLPGVSARVDGLRVVVVRKSERAPMTLSVPERPELELGKVTVETSDEFLALAVSHALLSLVGPHGLELEGDVIAIDGTLTIEELDVAHLHRVGKRLERGQAELMKQMERLQRGGR